MRLPDRFHPRRNLRARFALLAAGVVLLLASLLGLALDHVLRGEQWRAVSAGSQVMVRQLALALGLGLRDTLREVQQLALRPGFGRQEVEPASLRAGLERVREAQPGFVWLGVTDARGVVVAGTQTRFESQDLSDRAWFVGGRDGPWLGEVHESALLALRASSAPWVGWPSFLAIAAPVLDDQGRRVGVVTALLDWRWVAALVDGLMPPATQARSIEVLLRDAQAQIKLGPSALMAQPLRLGAAELSLGVGGVEVVQWPDGLAYLTTAAQIDVGNGVAGPGWQVLLRQPLGQARAAVARARWLMLLAGGLTTLVFMALGVWIAGRLAAPVLRLADSAERIRRGDAVGFPLDLTESVDEVGRLGRVLHHLQATLNQRMRELQQSSDRYLALFEHAPDAVLVHRNGAITEANHAAVQLFGAPNAAALTGRSIYTLLDPSVHERVRDEIARLRGEGGASPVAELRVRRLDGRELEVDATASTFMDGEVQCLHSVYRDITGRKAQDRRLAEQRVLLEQTSRMGHIGGWRYELWSGEVQWTQEISRMFEWADDVPRSRATALSAFQGAARKEIRAAFKRLVTEGRPYDLELPGVTTRGKPKWVRASAQPVWLNGRIVAVEGLTQDITDRKGADLALRALQVDLEHRVQARTAALSAANAELDSFAYAVSHDLRAPLRAMSGFARALAEDHGDILPVQARGYLDQITRASQRMGELIDALLTLSRVTRGVQRDDDIDLSALARRLREEFSVQAPDRAAHWVIEPGLRLRGDRRMIEVLLANLLGNAWKYTSRCATAQIRVGAVQRGGATWIEVADNGAGFDKAHAARLFQPFQRLHRQDEFAGLGIGLATAYRIVHRHGGQIEAEGRVGEGAVFRFCLGDVSEHPKRQGVS